MVQKAPPKQAALQKAVATKAAVAKAKAALPPPKAGKKGLPPPRVVEEEEEDEEYDEELDEEDDEEFEEDDEEFEGDDEEFDEEDEDDEEDDEGDDEEDDEEDLEFDDVADEEDEEGEDDDEDFEARAEKFKQKLQRETALAAAEAANDQSRDVRPTPLADLDGEEQVTGLMPSLSLEELEDRIKETLRVLGNFGSEREEGRTRDEYLALLRGDFQQMFEYNDYLMDTIMEMFPPQEAFEFMDAMEKPRPTTVRTNTLKCKRRDLVQILTKRGVNVEPLEKWSKVGLQIFDSNVPIAGTVEYLAGHYMLQSAVSFLPVMALAPQENERVLDMAAAPGGKTTYIAQLMRNSGVLFANDVSEPRIKSLNANIHRLGVTNAVVTQYDGVGYEKVMRNFDRVLIDAPCTGTGIISRDKSIKANKSLQDVQRASQLQRRLILSAIDATKPGGYVVYSTCSFLVEENEQVVDYALRQRSVEVVEMNLPFGRPGYAKFRHLRLNPQVSNSRRFFPHVHNMDGFYVCKLRKISNEAPATAGAEESANDNDQAKGAKKRGRENGAKKGGKNAASVTRPADDGKRASKLSVPPTGKPAAAAAPAAKGAKDSEKKKGEKTAVKASDSKKAAPNGNAKATAGKGKAPQQAKPSAAKKLRTEKKK